METNVTYEANCIRLDAQLEGVVIPFERDKMILADLEELQKVSKWTSFWYLSVNQPGYRLYDDYAETCAKYDSMCFSPGESEGNRSILFTKADNSPDFLELNDVGFIYYEECPELGIDILDIECGWDKRCVIVAKTDPEPETARTEPEQTEE